MKRWILLSSIVVLTACGGGGPVSGTATYRIEFSGSLNTGSSFQGAYATGSGQAEVFASSLPASKEISAGAGVYVAGQGTLVGSGGNLTVRVFKNNVLCEEKTQNITASGVLLAACNRP